MPNYLKRNHNIVMAKEIITPSQENLHEFEEVYNIISAHRNMACGAVNEQHLLECWEVGSYISGRLKSGRWGDSVVCQLADYLSNHQKRGFGKSNLYNMVKFYDTYSSEQFASLQGQLASSQFFQFRIGKSSSMSLSVENEEVVEQDPIFQFGIGKFPDVLKLTTYTNHIYIINHCRTAEERLFYIIYAYKERLQTKELQRCISSDTFANLLGGDKKNMSPALKDIHPNAVHLLKDQVLVDFLGLKPKHTEPKLKKAILEHLKEFILELGKDFLHVGTEYPLQVGSETFHVDLLFYHRALQCLVAVELKSKRFKPRDTGQLEFYLEALDRDVKRQNENPTIGMILCPDADNTVVEYAMNRTMSPMMVAQYKQVLIPQEVVQKALSEYVEFADEETKGARRLEK